MQVSGYLHSATLTMSQNSYCPDPFNYARRRTHEVRVGQIGIGGDQPIRVQSMTTTDTMDVEATVAQSIRMIDVGCELVRITAPSKRDAEALGDIASKLRASGHETPLVADIHFTPNAAEIAADHVEKIRVNPGNYADKKRFENLEYTDETYAEELVRIREKFTPLVQKCKRLGRAMRIGTNHGSLSDRIMSRYGDTALGMVESALEFLRICVDEGYHNVVVSMKSSNPQVMVQAYRLLVARMAEENMAFPLHLGVTEAGDGEDGRVKSALGIGTLLEDGLGDTVRVSLTEEPEAEMPVGRMLVERYTSRHGHEPIAPVDHNLDPFNYSRRVCAEVDNVGGKHVPVVVHTLREGDTRTCPPVWRRVPVQRALGQVEPGRGGMRLRVCGENALDVWLARHLAGACGRRRVARIAIAPRTTHPAVDRRASDRRASRPNRRPNPLDSRVPCRRHRGACGGHKDHRRRHASRRGVGGGNPTRPRHGRPAHHGACAR